MSQSAIMSILIWCKFISHNYFGQKRGLSQLVLIQNLVYNHHFPYINDKYSVFVLHDADWNIHIATRKADISHDVLKRPQTKLQSYWRPGGQQQEKQNIVRSKTNCTQQQQNSLYLSFYLSLNTLQIEYFYRQNCRQLLAIHINYFDISTSIY